MKFLLSLIAGVGIFMVLRVVLQGIFPGFAPVMLAVLCGTVGFIIARRFLKPIFDKKESSGTVADSTPAGQQAAKAVDEGMKVIMRMRNQTRMVPNNDAAKKIQDICKVGVEIFEDVKKNPKDLKKIKTFTNYYLDSTEKIVNQYVELSAKREKTPEILSSIEKVEALLDQIKVTFDKQLTSLLADDLLNLDVELSVLKKTMKYEG